MSLRTTRDAAEFGARLHSEGVPLGRVGSVVVELCKIGRKMQRLNERACNLGFEAPGQQAAEKCTADRLRDFYYLELEQHGIKPDEGSGDPRGCALYVHLPSGASNSWDDERGWCVPY